jgi:muconolactone delta-isomerase
MFYYVHLTERPCGDPQEERAMAGIRAQSITWLQLQYQQGKFEYVFKDSRNTNTYIFLNAQSHSELNELLDQDPLISYCYVEIEPLLTTFEMVDTLTRYLGTEEDYFTAQELEELKFHREAIDPDSTYFMARKVVKPFSPLLDKETQDRIHLNTLRSQKAHTDAREVADYNPVGKPVGILIMQAKTQEEVEEHVRACEVFVDTTVEYVRLLTLNKALDVNQTIVEKYSVGCFKETSVI